MHQSNDNQVIKNIKLKVCGMRDSDNINDLLALAPDYIGFIFYEKSARYAKNILSAETLARIPKNIKKTGVFVNENFDNILKIIDLYQLDAVQLHGNETPKLCESLKAHRLEVIKVFGVDEKFDFDEVKPYLNVADYFLFDTKSPKHGGTGQKFDWTKLSEYQHDKPFFLSGGIGIDSLAALQKIHHKQLYALDVNSLFEISPALKDVGLIRRFWQEFQNT